MDWWGRNIGDRVRDSPYGMIFTAPQSVLDDYSLSTSGSPSFPFVSQVYQFDGTTIVGSALFTSAIQFTTPGVFTTYTFAPNISLIAGDQYMAIMTNDPNGVSLGGNDPIFGGLGYAEGTNATGFAFDYAVGDPSIPANWLCKGPCLGALVAFNADFSDATPLPATLPLFASGLGVLGLLGWCRKRKKAALAA